MEVVKKIIDKRGKEVPILRPVKRIFEFNRSRGVFLCGTHIFYPSRISVKEIREDFIAIGNYEIIGEVISPDGESLPFSIDWGIFQKWESVPEEIREEIRKEIEKREKEKEERIKEEWRKMKENEEVKKLIEQWKNKWISKVEKEERKLKEEICEIYKRLEKIAEELKTIQVVDLQLITKTYSSHSQTTWIFKFKSGKEKYFRTESWNGIDRDDEPNRLTGVGLGDWFDTTSCSELERLRDEYERGYSLRKEKEKLIKELEEKLGWLEMWESQSKKIRFEDTGTDLRVYIFRPWGSWLEGQSFKAWYVANVIFEGE